MKSSFRNLVILLALLAPAVLQAQVFYFLQTSTTIVKTTAQSPAHWYLEINNNVGVDTTLRWKADLSAIPPGWDINMDDQNSNHTNLQNGDSADFVLFGGLSVPQKLIIGAATNNIPGTASAFFDIYDPHDTASHVTIEYNFIITQATGFVSVEADPDLIQCDDGHIIFSFHQLTAYSIVSAAGQEVRSGSVEQGTVDVSGLRQGIYFIYFFSGSRRQVKKIAL